MESSQVLQSVQQSQSIVETSNLLSTSKLDEPVITDTHEDKFGGTKLSYSESIPKLEASGELEVGLSGLLFDYDEDLEVELL